MMKSATPWAVGQSITFRGETGWKVTSVDTRRGFLTIACPLRMALLVGMSHPGIKR